MDQFKQSMKFMRPALIGKVKAAKEAGHDGALWDLTVKEAESGLLDGPHPLDYFDAKYAGAWMPVRRFGVMQSSGSKTKLRPIDDFSENRVNQTFGYADKIGLRALDELVTAAQVWTRTVLGDGRVHFTLSDGSEFEGRLHQAWRQPTGRKLLVTALDLKNVYKQFALSPSSRAFAILLLREPKTSRVSGFESAALPFGSTASVCHFNRLARLFRAIGCRLHLMWFNYFDDYPVISRHQS